MSKQVVNVKGYVQLKDDPDCLYIMPYVYKDNEHVYVINGDGNVVLMGYNLLLMVSTNRAEGDTMVEAVSHDHRVRGVEMSCRSLSLVQTMGSLLLIV